MLLICQQSLFKQILEIETKIKNSRDFILQIAIRNLHLCFIVNLIATKKILLQLSKYLKLLIYESDKNNRNLTKFISSESLVYASENCQFILNSVYNIYSHIVIEDIVSYYDKVKSSELCLQ